MSTIWATDPPEDLGQHNEACASWDGSECDCAGDRYDAGEAKWEREDLR